MLILREGAHNLALLFKEAIKREEPVIFPTDTIYGIGAPLSAIIANKKIFDIKKRHLNIPFPIISGSWNQARQIAEIDNLSKEQSDFIQKHKISPITYIFKSKPSVNAVYTKEGTIAVRVTHQKWLSDALKILGESVTATSVNLSKEHAAENFEKSFKLFSNSVCLYLRGMPPLGKSSEIYDMTNDDIRKIR